MFGLFCVATKVIDMISKLRCILVTAMSENQASITDQNPRLDGIVVHQRRILEIRLALGVSLS